MKIKTTFFLYFLLYVAAVFSGESIPKGSVVVVIGTRPEAVKLIPVYQALREANVPTILLSTGQHADMLKEIFNLFQVAPDFDLEIMRPNQNLFHISQAVLAGTKDLFEEIKPSMVVVQGDTTSAFTAALAAYYLKIPVAHVEAGLRTGNIYAPFPEEMNRQLLTRLATLNFAPTPLSVEHLKEENVKESDIFLTGNTVVDALNHVRSQIINRTIKPSVPLQGMVDRLKTEGKKILLLTAHRRESLGNGLEQIFSAIKLALEKHPELHVIYPMHPNPAIHVTAQKIFGDKTPKLEIISPLPYQDIIYLLDQVDLVATDSGGIQEEAVSLKKPTLVLRNETDRPEGLQGNLAVLVGTEREAILEGIDSILVKKTLNELDRPSPYGDGLASQRIATIIKQFLKSN